MNNIGKNQRGKKLAKYARMWGENTFKITKKYGEFEGWATPPNTWGGVVRSPPHRLPPDHLPQNKEGFPMHPCPRRTFFDCPNKYPSWRWWREITRTIGEVTKPIKWGQKKDQTEHSLYEKRQKTFPGSLVFWGQFCVYKNCRLCDYSGLCPPTPYYSELHCIIPCNAEIHAELWIEKRIENVIKKMIQNDFLSQKEKQL